MENLLYTESAFLRVINRKRKDSIAYQRTVGFDKVMSATSWRFGDVMNYTSMDMNVFLKKVTQLRSMKDIDLSEALSHVPQTEFNDAYLTRENYNRKEFISSIFIPLDKLD